MQQNVDEGGTGQELKMAMAFSKLPAFAPSSSSFDVFVERLELYTTVNEIAEAKKLHLFLGAIGKEAYVTLRSLLLPKTPSTSSYQEVVSALKKHYYPRRSVVSERYHFNQRKQAPQETVAEYVVQLKKLASLCDFGAFLEQALRDRLIAGLHLRRPTLPVAGHERQRAHLGPRLQHHYGHGDGRERCRGNGRGKHRRTVIQQQ
ncbi:hypothetical protein MTO96_039506 [Rhipicephalus appendiculatus]